MVIATVMMCATTYQIGTPDVPQRFQPGDVAMNSEPVPLNPLIAVDQRFTRLRLAFSLASLSSVTPSSGKMLDANNRI